MMSFVTTERWRHRKWVAQEPSLAAEDRASVFVDAWGVPLRKRLLHPVIAHQSIEGGRRFDLDAHSRLEWRESNTLTPFEMKPGELAHLCEHGAHLTSLRLDRIPDVCEWRHELETPAGTVFAYQPALTAEEIRRGWTSPPAVVGSYAVFAGDDGRKAWHIPRPVARDRDGLNPVWGRIRIRDGISTVTFDRAALLALRLPITIYGLDTIGYTSIGAQVGNTSGGAELEVFGPWLCGFTGTTDNIRVYTCILTGTPAFTLGVYPDNGGTPDGQARVVDTGEITAGGSAAWQISNTDSAAPVIADNYYWVAMADDANGGCRIYGDAATSEYWRYATVAYVIGAVPATCPATSAYLTKKIAAYVTYTPTAAGPLPMAMQHYRQLRSA